MKRADDTSEPADELCVTVLFMSVSVRWKTMLGYADDEIGNEPEEWLGRVHPDDRSEMEASISAHIGGGNSHFEQEFRVIHGDGTYRCMLTRGLAVRSMSGQACRMAGSVRLQANNPFFCNFSRDIQ